MNSSTRLTQGVSLAFLLVACTADDLPSYLASLINNAEIREVSGIACGTSHYWLHNDSGDSPRLFGINPEGKVMAEIQVAGASAIDWEDIAVAQTPQGDGLFLYIADTGNNLRTRDDLVVYRIAEPTLPAAPPRQPLRSAPATALRFRYADGNFDCEGLVATADGSTLFLFTKEPETTGIYRLDVEAASGGGTQSLERITTISLLGQVTGAALSVRGTQLVLSTTRGIFEYDGLDAQTVVNGEFGKGKALAQYTTTRIEAVCYSSEPGFVMAVAEGYPAPLYRVPGSRAETPHAAPTAEPPRSDR